MWLGAMGGGGVYIWAWGKCMENGVVSLVRKTYMGGRNMFGEMHFQWQGPMNRDTMLA